MRTPGRRWLIVAALFVVTYANSTLLAAYGVFLPVLADAFGWSRGAISSALSLNLLLGGLTGPVIGALADRHGPRGVLVATVALAGAGFGLVSTVDALWQLYLLVGLAGGVGMSSFYLVSAATVARWFDERRGLALALVLVGFNVGYVTGGPLAAWLIEAWGWRSAYALLGVGCGAMAGLAASTVRRPAPGDAAVPGRSSGPPHLSVGRSVTLAEALADPRQWCLNLAWFLLGGIAIMLTVHIVPFARDRGVGLAGASLALTAYGVGAVTGRLATGVVSDRLGARVTIGAAYVLKAVSLSVLLWAPSQEILLGSLVVFGLGFAASDTMIVRVIPDVFGLRAIGAIMGVLALGWRIGAGAGPAVAGFVHDVTGSYTLPFGAAPLAVLVSWGLFEIGIRSSRAAAAARAP